MRYAWSSLRGWWVLLLATMLGPVTVSVRDVSIFLPTLSEGSPFGAVPLAAIAPLILVILTGAAQAQASPATLTVSVRPIHRLHLAFLTLAIAVYVSSYALTCEAFTQPALLSPIRNVIAYAALHLLARLVFTPHLAPFLAPLYVFVSTAFGRAKNGDAQPWAWPTVDASPADLLIALGIFALLATVTLTRDFARAPR